MGGSDRILKDLMTHAANTAEAAAELVVNASRAIDPDFGVRIWQAGAMGCFKAAAVEAIARFRRDLGRLPTETEVALIIARMIGPMADGLKDCMVQAIKDCTERETARGQ